MRILDIDNEGRENRRVKIGSAEEATEAEVVAKNPDTNATYILLWSHYKVFMESV